MIVTQNRIRDMEKRIQQESFRLFKKHGIHYVTMDMIAENLGISKKTIYKHFSGKKEILMACMTEHVDERSELIDRIIEDSPNVIHGMIDMVQSSTQQMSETNPIMFKELARYYPQIFESIIKNREKEAYEQFFNIISEGKNKGLFRTNLNTDITTKLFIHQMQLLIDEELFPVEKYDKKSLYEHISYTFIRGIATHEGQMILKDYLNDRKPLSE